VEILAVGVRFRSCENDPVAKLKPLDAWSINSKVLSAELFQHFLQVAQGLEVPREGLRAGEKY